MLFSLNYACNETALPALSCISGVMVSVFISSEVDRGFQL